MVTISLELAALLLASAEVWYDDPDTPKGSGALTELFTADELHRVRADVLRAESEPRTGGPYGIEDSPSIDAGPCARCGSDASHTGVRLCSACLAEAVDLGLVHPTPPPEATLGELERQGPPDEAVPLEGARCGHGWEGASHEFTCVRPEGHDGEHSTVPLRRDYVARASYAQAVSSWRHAAGVKADDTLADLCVACLENGAGLSVRIEGLEPRTLPPGSEPDGSYRVCWDCRERWEREIANLPFPEDARVVELPLGE